PPRRREAGCVSNPRASTRWPRPAACAPNSRSPGTSMRATALVALVGVPAYLVAMVLTTPATFIGERASKAAGGQVRVSDAQGNLWSGNLRATIDAPGGPFAFDHVTWRFLPGAIVRGRIGFDVTFDSREASGHAQLLRGFTGWEARGVN